MASQAHFSDVTEYTHLCQVGRVPYRWWASCVLSCGCTCMQIRPYLMSDGGNVEFVEIDGPTVYLRLAGACGSCPSSLTTMTMGIKRRLMEKIPVSEVVGCWTLPVV